MIKVYIHRKKEKVPIIELIRPNLGIQYEFRWTDRHIVPQKNIVEIVANIEESEYILMPHNYNHVKKDVAYLSEFQNLSQKYKKKIIIFFPGDSCERVLIDDCIVFRNSQYRHLIQKNEIIMPAYVADLGNKYLSYLKHKSEIPVISFCGWARFGKFSLYMTAFIRMIIVMISNMGSGRLFVRGIWLRKKVLRLLKNSKLVKTDFIVRPSYSGNEKTLSLDEKTAEKEYLENILKNDFTLCIKGDGNFSSRFYETLSLGRLPLLIDTECVLPLEDEIDYKSFVVSVDYKHIRCIDRQVLQRFSQISDKEYIEMQDKARLVFTKYLRIDSYFAHVFEDDYFNTLIEKIYGEK